MEIGKGREGERESATRAHSLRRPSFPMPAKGICFALGPSAARRSRGGREREDRPARKKWLRRARERSRLGGLEGQVGGAALSVRVRPFVLPHAYVPRETKWALYITDYSSCSDTHCNEAASDYSFWTLSEENTYPVTVTQQAIAALDEIQSAVLS